jgi:hypothetical protein
MEALDLVHRLIGSWHMVAFKMGRRPYSCRTQGGRISEPIRNRSGSRRPIFKATLRAAAGRPFFGVARSIRPPRRMLVAPPASAQAEALRAGRALKNNQLTCGHMPATNGTMH